jgi:hypothetical protein
VFLGQTSDLHAEGRQRHTGLGPCRSTICLAAESLEFPPAIGAQAKKVLKTDLGQQGKRHFPLIDPEQQLSREMNVSHKLPLSPHENTPAGIVP